MALTKEDVVSALRTCMDPEIPINIVDLGLVYEVDLPAMPSSAASSGHDVHVKMTLTSPGCPMSHSISHEVHKKLLQLSGVHSAKVDIVWEPIWRPDMISAEGRQHLNLA